jgi:hypothetical protein
MMRARCDRRFLLMHAYAMLRLTLVMAAILASVLSGFAQSPTAKPASEGTKSEAQATPTPKANEETEGIEEMNDWSGPSPDGSLVAVTRVIPDPAYIYRHDLDSVAVAVFRFGDEGPSVVARHDFGHRLIARIEWSPDSKFLLFTTASSGGHSPWHAAAFLFSVSDDSFHDVDAAIGNVVSPKFHFDSPDIASMEVKKGEAEEGVKVSLSKAIQHMPRVR